MTGDRLIQLIEEAGYEVYGGGYSGRAMYGKRCVGYTVSRDDSPLASVAAIIAPVDELDEREDLADLFRNARQDSLGLDTIVYFPNVAFEGEG